MAFLEALDHEGVDHCVLRNHEEIPIEPGRDIDLIAEDALLPTIERILSPIAVQEGWHDLVRCRGHHEGTSYYLTRNAGGLLEQLEFHFTRIRWARIPVLTPGDVISRRLRAPNGLWIADPVHVAIQRTMQFGLSGQLIEMKPEYWNQTRRVAVSREADLARELTALIGSTVIPSLVRAISSNRREEAAEILLSLRRSFVIRQGRRNPMATIIAMTTAASDRVGRSRPAFCGVVMATSQRDSVPDLQKSIAPLFLRVLRYESQDLDRKALSEAREVARKAGAVIVTSDDPELEVRRPSWGGTGVVINDPSDVGPVMRRFVDNHAHV